MTNKKISIIGGGISGCIAAYELSCLGFSVSIYEKKNKIGGTYYDVKDKDELYFNGPQYFLKNSKWLKKLRLLSNFKNDFNDYKSYNIKDVKYNIYRSYTDLYNEEITSNLFASPVTTIKYSGIKQKKFGTLKERLSCYQKNIFTPIDIWCKRISVLYDKLHYSCAEKLNIGRIFFFNDSQKIKNIKKGNILADYILGIPIHDKKHVFTLPKQGPSNFLRKLENLLKRKIDINFNTSISIDKKNNKINFLNNGKLIKSDLFIWAANPVPLLKSLGYGTLDNPVTKVKVYCANIFLSKKLETENFYIQVFSNKSNIFRIYIYKFKNKYKISIETFFQKDIEIDNKYVEKILNKFNVKVKYIDKYFEIKEVRHNLLTEKDYNMFKAFEKDFTNSNIVGGGWHFTGREEKIDYILDKVKEYA